MRHRLVPGSLLVPVLVVLLAACASGSDDDAGSGTSDSTASATEESTADATAGTVELELTAGWSAVGLPSELGTPPADAVAGVARTSDDALIAVVTFGSSTCPQVADARATGVGDQVTVTFPTPEDGPCTLDYVPATSVVELPAGTDAEAELTVIIGDWGSVTLPTGSTDAAWATATEG